MQSNNNGGHEPPHKANDQQDEEHQKSVENDETNLEFESLSREELIKLVKNMKSVAKKEAKESSKLAHNLATLEKALLVSQQKVEELTGQMANQNAVEEREKLATSEEEMDKGLHPSTEQQWFCGNPPIPSKTIPLKSPVNNNNGFAIILSCSTSAGVELRYLQMPEAANSAEIHLGSGPRNLCNVWAKTTQKSKRLRNPQSNEFSRSNAEIIISHGGLSASKNTNGWHNILGEKGFPISVADCRKDCFPGTICYYYEVKISKRWWCTVIFGLSDEGFPPHGVIGSSPNSYAIHLSLSNGNFYHFFLAGQRHRFEFPEGVIRPELKDAENVVGCGILIDPDDKLAIFFTLNGILIARQFPIDPTMVHLIPTVTSWDEMSVEGNFGNNPAKPFEYDIKKCPGMGMEWI